MKKCITAALLVLVMIFSMLPAGAYATEGAEQIYQLGEITWVFGYDASPTAPTAVGTMWQLVLDADGVPVTVFDECPVPLHRHLTSCYDAKGNEICGFRSHPRHTDLCSLKYADYMWQVVEDPNYEPPESDPDNDVPEGSASLTVYNTDTKGEPLVGAEFMLLRPGTEGNDELKAQVYTDEFGEAQIRGICLDEDFQGTTEIWYLAQNMPETSALSNYYRPNTDKWDVIITRDEAGVHSLRVEPQEADQTAGGQGYDPQTNTLTVINEPISGSLLINTEFYVNGTQTSGIPEEMETSVILDYPDGARMSVLFPVDRAGFSPWQDQKTDLKVGTYTLSQPEAAEVEGYTLESITIEVQRPVPEGETPVREEASSVTLNKKDTYATFFVMYHFSVEEVPTEPTDPSGESTEPADPGIEISNTVCIRVMDENQRQTAGATVALIDSNGETVQTFTGEGDQLFDLSDRVTEEKQTYSLVQTLPPQGHAPAPERYTLELGRKQDGTAQVVLKKDQTFLENVVSFFSGDGILVDSETGAQMAIFTNERKTTQIQITNDVDLLFQEGAWKDTQMEEQYKQEATFHLTWTDAFGETFEQELKAVNGSIGTFEARIPYEAQYTVEVISGPGPAFQGSRQISGKVELTHLDAPISLDASASYTVEAGTSQPLTLVMVDAEDGAKTLAGMTFTLSQEGVDGALTYTSDENGRLVVQGAYAEPVSFVLTQNQPLEGYFPLNGPIHVNVLPVYVPRSAEEPAVLIQNLIPTVTHEAAQPVEAGTYRIANAMKEVGEPVEEEGSGKIQIRVVSESGSPVEGTQVTMTCPDGSKISCKNGDLIDMAQLGMTGTYSLVQTKSVTGHNLATETYDVTVSQKDGKFTVKPEYTNQGLLDKIFNRKEVAVGEEGQWLLTFTNVRMTATLRLTCEVAVNFAAGSWHDTEFEKKYKEETQYQFLLSWDDGYAREQDEAMLVHGESEIFELQVPYGVSYEIVCVNEKGYFDTTFRNAKTTVVDTTALKEGMQITATNTYIIEPNPDADPVELNLVKVDAVTRSPLEGVSFELLDSDGRKVAAYTSDPEGRIQIANVLNIGGTYSLKETEALSGYEVPSKPFAVDVDAEYTVFKASGRPVLKQSFAASITNKAVEEQEDGSYLVKNYKKGQTPDDGDEKGWNPKTGDDFQILLWSGMLTVSLAGAVLTGLHLKKRQSRG